MKILLEKHVFLIDLNENVAKFYKLQLVSVGYNKIQLLTTQGNMNGNGRSSFKVFEGEKSFSTSKKIFYSKLLELKSQGYFEKEDFLKWFKYFDERHLDENVLMIKDRIQVKNDSKKQKNKIKQEKIDYKCSLCEEKIAPTLYHKINEWARGEGNWDADEIFVGYDRVLCINCQIEHDIFKKKNN